MIKSSVLRLQWEIFFFLSNRGTFQQQRDKPSDGVQTLMEADKTEEELMN